MNLNGTSMAPSLAEMIKEGKKNNTVKEINLGQSGAIVYELDGTRILKHVIRDKIDNGMFDTYVKEALFYQAKCPGTFLPKVDNLEILPDEIIIVMKKYNSLNRADFSEDLLKKIAGVLACIHSESVPEFLSDNDARTNLLSQDDIAGCAKGWQSVLDEHPGAFDDSVIDKISQDINDIISWHNFLHGNDTERVRGIFDKMVSDYRECWS